MTREAPRPQPDKEEYTEEKMFERLHLASRELNEDMGLYEASAKAEDLVQRGLLVKFPYQEGGQKEDVYYVPVIQYRSSTPDSERRSDVGENRVFSVEQSPDFHTNIGWKDIAYTIYRLDPKGRRTHWIRRDAESMHVSERGVQTFFPNGNRQRVEFYKTSFGDEAKTNIYEYAENDPNTPTFHKVIDHRTGKEEIRIDKMNQEF